MENLWPDFDEIQKGSTPRAILQEQAKALGEKFQNKIEGRTQFTRDGDSFVYIFLLHCAPLGYSYRLFRAGYKFVELYPVTVKVVGDIAEELCNTKEEVALEASNEEKFKDILRAIFSSKKTKNMIYALLLHLE